MAPDESAAHAGRKLFDLTRPGLAWHGMAIVTLLAVSCEPRLELISSLDGRRSLTILRNQSDNSQAHLNVYLRNFSC